MSGAFEKARLWTDLVRQRLARPERARVLATSVDLCRDPALAAALGRRPALATRLLPNRPETVVGWGYRPSGRRAARIARHRGSDLLIAEDGPLGPERPGGSRLSCVLDDLCPAYDAARASRLEALIAEGTDASGRTRARHLATLWTDLGLAKSPTLPAFAGPLPDAFVLVIDQTPGDLSIRHGGADAAAFGRMLAAARAENPGRTVVVKSHPSGRAHLRPDGAPDTLWITAPCHPAPLLASALRVYTVTSQTGFEALIHRRPVRTFGMPFYAGWGLTEDDLPPPHRRKPVPLEDLIHAVLVAYPTYVDPETGARIPPETAFERAARRAVVTGATLRPPCLRPSA